MAIWVAAVLVLVLSDACGPAPSPSLVRTSHPLALAGTAWWLVAIDGRAVPRGDPITLQFGSVELDGDGPCNGFGGSFVYRETTGSLRIEDLARTLRECFDSVRSQLETMYFDGLRRVADASIDPNGRLVLSGPGPELTFEVGPQQVGPGVTLAPSAAR